MSLVEALPLPHTVGEVQPGLTRQLAVGLPPSADSALGDDDPPVPRGGNVLRGPLLGSW